MRVALLQKWTFDQEFIHVVQNMRLSHEQVSRTLIAYIWSESKRSISEAAEKGM